MSYRTILVELQRNGSMEARLRATRALAARFEATLVGIHIVPTPFVPASYGEAAAYLGPRLLEEQRAASRQVRDEVRAIFERVCGTGSQAVWQEAEGDPGRLLVAAAHGADLVVTAKRDLPVLDVPAVVEELTLGAGVPVVMLPPDLMDVRGSGVLVAWNGSREAARAVREGLPFLRRAERVVMCAIGRRAIDSLDAAQAMVGRHGVTVTGERIDQPDGDAGEVLLAQAAAHGADLLIMGAYGHGRLRELVFGGATRHVLHEAKLPVLFGC